MTIANPRYNERKQFNHGEKKMKQAERISEASFLVNHMSYQSGMSRAFKSAAKVFQDVIDEYDGPVRAPKLKELFNLPVDIDDDYDYYFKVERLTLSNFCDKLSAEIYAIIDRGIERYDDMGANFEHYKKWCDFVNHFGAKKFSKLFQKTLLTNRAVCIREFDGEKVLEFGANENLWEFVFEQTSPLLHSKLV